MKPIPLPPPAQAALFLDVDGTLLELAPTPESVVVGAETLALLDAARRRLDGALALISGRPLTDLDRLFAPHRLAAAGTHGLEWRLGEGAETRRMTTPAGWREALEPALQDFAARDDGLLLEDKGHALALHYRGAPARQAEAEALAGQLLRSLAQPARLLRGKMVLEFLPAGTDKGRAIETFMNEAPWRDRVPVFIGDDVTDEAGFAMVNRLGGCSIRVGQGAGSLAHHAIGDVRAVHVLLQDWLD